jgi:hypothetical protein
VVCSLQIEVSPIKLPQPDFRDGQPKPRSCQDAGRCLGGRTLVRIWLFKEAGRLRCNTDSNFDALKRGNRYSRERVSAMLQTGIRKTWFSRFGLVGEAA